MGTLMEKPPGKQTTKIKKIGTLLLKIESTSFKMWAC